MNKDAYLSPELALMAVRAVLGVQAGVTAADFDPQQARILSSGVYGGDTDGSKGTDDLDELDALPVIMADGQQSTKGMGKI